YLFAIALGFSATWYGINYNDILWEKLGNLLITAAVGGATIIMVYFIALQAIATREMVEKASIQAQLTYEMVKQMIEETTLMNESLIEMRKQRLNIEEFKNSLITYLRNIIGILKANSMSTNYTPVTDPYLYVLQGYRRGSTAKDLSPAELGLVWRISVFIKKFLELCGLSWQRFEEYNKLISKFKDSKTSQSEKPGFAMRIKETSKELLKTVESIFDEVERMSDRELEEEILKILES
ncbi:hypothetical protein DRN38_03820, partial [Thermococci archaeon]